MGSIPQSTATINATNNYNNSISPTHMYSRALQLKLYQAFIFSIPVLFSIILILLFYLFYLKRRSNSNLPPPPDEPTISSHGSPYFNSAPYDEMGFKGELQIKLPKVIFDEDLREKDPVCCVCLGEFEMKEELAQVGGCKHLFHIECINHWLQSNATCPLCRSSVLSSASNFPSKSSLLTTTSNMLVEEASSSSTTSIIINARDFNDNENDQPISLHILVHN